MYFNQSIRFFFQVWQLSEFPVISADRNAHWLGKSWKRPCSSSLLGREEKAYSWPLWAWLGFLCCWVQAHLKLACIIRKGMWLSTGKVCHLCPRHCHSQAQTWWKQDCPKFLGSLNICFSAYFLAVTLIKAFMRCFPITYIIASLSASFSIKRGRPENHFTCRSFHSFAVSRGAY